MSKIDLAVKHHSKLQPTFKNICLGKVKLKKFNMLSAAVVTGALKNTVQVPYNE